MKIQKTEIIRRLKVFHERGYLEVNKNLDYSTLFIGAAPDYDYSNWTDKDLKDLAKSIIVFLREKRKDETTLPKKLRT